MISRRLLHYGRLHDQRRELVFPPNALQPHPVEFGGQDPLDRSELFGEASLSATETIGELAANSPLPYSPFTLAHARLELLPLGVCFVGLHF